MNNSFVKKDNRIITLTAYLTASGKYPEREHHVELNSQLYENASNLLNNVNAFLIELGIKEATVSSGFRPSNINASIPNASKKSLHMTCQAIDILDINGELDALILEAPQLLKKHNLWLEHPIATPTWCHLDISTNRKDRNIRIFKP